MLLFVLVGAGGLAVLGLLAAVLLVVLVLPAVQGAREATQRDLEKAAPGVGDAPSAEATGEPIPAAGESPQVAAAGTQVQDDAPVVEDSPTLEEEPPEPTGSPPSDPPDSLRRQVAEIERQYHETMERADQFRGRGVRGGAHNLEIIAQRQREDAYLAVATASDMTVEELKEIARERDD